MNTAIAERPPRIRMSAAIKRRYAPNRPWNRNSRQDSARDCAARCTATGRTRIRPGPKYHAFLGDGMIHGFWLEEGRARYANRYVRTPRWLAEHAAGRALFGGLGVPSDPSVEKVLSGGANTHIVYHAGKLLALQEGSNPFEMDPSNLTSKGWVETGGRFTAHPKVDPDSGEMVWFAYSAGETPLNPYLDYGISDSSGRIMRRDRFKAPYCSMVHDFIVTQHYTAFPVLPLTGDIERAKRGLPAFAWEPEKGAFVGLMARGASVDSVRWIEVDPVYVFHPANAYEQDGYIHCDMMEYPSAPLFPNPDGSRRAPVKARMVRWSVDLADTRAPVVRTPVSDLVGEFPRIDDRFTGLRYRHCWHAANAELNEVLMFDSLAHIRYADQAPDVAAIFRWRQCRRAGVRAAQRAGPRGRRLGAGGGAPRTRESQRSVHSRCAGHRRRTCGHTRIALPRTRRVPRQLGARGLP